LVSPEKNWRSYIGSKGDHTATKQGSIAGKKKALRESKRLCGGGEVAKRARCPTLALRGTTSVDGKMYVGWSEKKEYDGKRIGALLQHPHI